MPAARRRTSTAACAAPSPRCSRIRTSSIRNDAPDEALPPGTVYRIDDLSLASRLSFFLWSSLPDDELLDMAAAGKLHDPQVLEQQVRRMLADPRSIDAGLATSARSG